MSDIQYSAICQSCGWKRKNNDIIRRWDGLLVCKDTCYEPRNILDFYKPRNDAHKLPWTSPDGDSPGVVWAPTITGFGGGVDPNYNTSYVYDPSTKLFTYNVEVKNLGGTASATSMVNPTITLPYTVATDKKGTLMTTNRGRVPATFSAVAALLTITATLTTSDTILIRGSLVTT